MALNKAQEDCGKKYLSLMQDVPTCWDSQLAMIDRLIELKPYLIPVCHGGRYGGKEVMPDKERKAHWPNEFKWKASY